MTKIESKTVVVPAQTAEIYTYLSDLNNFKELLPQDKISDWESDVQHCSFKVQGGYKIGLEWSSGTEHSTIVLKSMPVSPFPFTLTINLEAVEDGTKGYQVCDADINAFLKMMVEKPLKNLFDYIADQLVKKFS